MTDRRWYAPTQPRAVANGLKARSSRGAIGQSWWSLRFLEVLESFAMGSRLTRGRTYARKGQVVSLDVVPGQVRASVQGSPMASSLTSVMAFRAAATLRSKSSTISRLLVSFGDA